MCATQTGSMLGNNLYYKLWIFTLLLHIEQICKFPHHTVHIRKEYETSVRYPY